MPTVFTCCAPRLDAVTTVILFSMVEATFAGASMGAAALNLAVTCVRPKGVHAEDY